MSAECLKGDEWDLFWPDIEPFGQIRFLLCKNYEMIDSKNQENFILGLIS